MNLALTIHEIAVLVLGLGVLLMDLWTPAERKRWLGYGAAAGLGLILAYSLVRFDGAGVEFAFGQSYVLDALALFFKRFFLLAASLVLILAVEFAERLAPGVVEFYSLVLFALTGMMFAASAHDFALLFVSLELVTVTFYVLTSFQRRRLASLEAGVKYLILGALSTAFMVYGITLVYGVSGTLSFGKLTNTAAALGQKPLFLAGLLLILAGLTFKIAAFPLPFWAPDVYQGSPLPATAFLAVGSKAAGFVLLLRVLFTAVPAVTTQWTNVLLAISAVSILYGNLCAIPQRSLKRLLGYSSIAHAGYLLLGVAAMSSGAQSEVNGAAALLFYLGGYLFTVLGAFAVLCLILLQTEDDDISSLAGLNRRSPFLAAALTLAMVSLAGVPPLAGFFGKFLLIKAALEQGSVQPHFYWLVGITLLGLVVSLWYYFGIVRAIYWSAPPARVTPVPMSWPLRWTVVVCMAGMLWVGLFPSALVQWASRAVSVW
jgi:NADH-quinone oxidoreductase subunit N